MRLINRVPGGLSSSLYEKGKVMIGLGKLFVTMGDIWLLPWYLQVAVEVAAGLLLHPVVKGLWEGRVRSLKTSCSRNKFLM